jgi:hypothetical protein
VPVLGTPTNKCSHGVYAAGETRDGKPWSRHCSMCNDNLSAAPSTRRPARAEREETELDAADFLALPVGERLRGGHYVGQGLS